MDHIEYIAHPDEPAAAGRADAAELARLALSSRSALRREVLGRARADARYEAEASHAGLPDAWAALSRRLRNMRHRAALLH